MGTVRAARHRCADRGDDPAQLAGLTRLDLPLVLCTLVTEDPDRARVAWFIIHLVVGPGFRLGVRGHVPAP
jgi:hypothetical protein